MTRWQANAVLLGVALIWGSAFVAQAQAMAHLGPMAFTGVRFLLGAAVVAPLAWREQRFLRQRGLKPHPADALPVAGLGLLLGLGAALQQVGIQGTTVTNAALLTALYVPLVPLLAWARTGRAPRAVLWPAAAGCVAGTWLLSGASRLEMRPGDAWVLASVLPWAVHVLFIGEVAQRLAAPFSVACGQFLVCGAASLAWAAAAEPLSLAMLWAAWPAILYTGVVSVGIGFTAQVVAQRHAAPADAAILMSSEILFAGLFGYALMGDRLNSAGWLGAAFIVASLLLVQWPQRERAKAGAPAPTPGAAPSPPPR